MNYLELFLFEQTNTPQATVICFFTLEYTDAAIDFHLFFVNNFLEHSRNFRNALSRLTCNNLFLMGSVVHELSTLFERRNRTKNMRRKGFHCSAGKLRVDQTSHGKVVVSSDCCRGVDRR